uniref:Penicillin-binding protein 1C n=1 Tax=Cyanothece sp. (strain PCC 7425 / ATCC 29141) TaxID=395961 RepID=B8HLR2_CYAP4
MQNRSIHILNWAQKICHHPISKGFILISGLALAVRMFPYLIPIHAADLVQEDQAIEFRDRNHLYLGTLLTRDQNHTAVIALQQVSPHFIQAILAAEDGRFYQHGPLDGLAIARSLRDSLQAGEITSGASTLTMQLARMVNPTPATLGGKVQEIWLAWRLAAGMSRDEILQAYINRLPMGGNVYGVEAAARVYFGVSATDLTPAQASLLAALPNDPTDLHPYRNWPGLKQRQRYVLRRMVEEGHLTAAQSHRIAQEPVTLQPRHQGIRAAPHFLFWVATQLPAHAPAQVQTTLDLPLQQFVETQVQQVVRSLRQHNGHQAAALVIDNQSGEVLAYVGSPDYFQQLQLGENDGVQALRQPGSALKPFLYALALEQRVIRPNTILADVPTHYAIPGARLYSPQDYSQTFLGPVRVRLALANSLNIPAVRVLEQVGVATFLNRLRQLGFQHLNRPPDYYGLGLTLGSGEVNLWELARAYATIARLGQPPGLKVVKTDRPEQPRTGSHSDPLARIGTATDWALIIDMLSDPHARARAFGVESVLQLPFPAAVKTGTSSSYRDTWTIGFTRDYTVATWVGNFNGEPMRKISGVTGAAPLWNRIMLHLHKDQEPAPFPAPQGLVQRPICALSGWKPTPPCPTVVQEYFTPEDLAAYDRHRDTLFQVVPASNQKKSPSYRLNLPPEYNEWLATQGSLAGDTTLRIAFPRNGDYFLIQPADAVERNPNKQAAAKLEFKLAGTPDHPVEWRLNGQLLATQSAPSLFWKLRPGTWTLQIRSGEQTESVQFEVAVGQPSQRRGFSLSQLP